MRIELPPMDSDTLKKLKTVCEEQLGVTRDQVTPEARLEEDLGADSLDMTEFIMAIEEEWGVDIPDAEAEKLKTIRDIGDYLERNAA